MYVCYVTVRMKRNVFWTGSRGWRVNFEATSVEGRNLIRRCLIISWKKLNPQTLQEMFNPNLGAVLIIIPSDISRLNAKEREVRRVKFRLLAFL